MYIDFADYSEIYHDLEANDFPYYCLKACLELDRQTTGIDGFAKLENAFPTNEKHAMAVKICACELVHYLHLVDMAMETSGYDKNADGKYVGKQVHSVSSGSESVTFSAGSSAFDLSAIDPKAKRQYINSMVTDLLGGITDKNGVNLLFMGAYPYVSE